MAVVFLLDDRGFSADRRTWRCVPGSGSGGQDPPGISVERFFLPPSEPRVDVVKQVPKLFVDVRTSQIIEENIEDVRPAFQERITEWSCDQNHVPITTNAAQILEVPMMSHNSTSTGKTYSSSSLTCHVAVLQMLQAMDLLFTTL